MSNIKIKEKHINKLLAQQVNVFNGDMLKAYRLALVILAYFRDSVNLPPVIWTGVNRYLIIKGGKYAKKYY